MDVGIAAVGTTPDHSTDLPDIVSHATEAQVPTTIAMTHHTADLHPIEIFPVMTADLNTNPTDNITNQYKDLLTSSKTTPWECKHRRQKQVTIDNPPSEYYSSDDQDSDSEDNLN